MKVGDRVVPSLFFTCDECYYCRIGRHQQCAHLKGILGVLCPGAFAEYFKVPARNVFRLPDSISFEAGGLIADAVVTAVHASRRGGLVAGGTGVVIGAGGVGLCLVQVLAASGVRVAAVDVDKAKLDSGSRSGAAAVFLAQDAPSEALRWAGEDGVQCVFDCVGSAQSLENACRIVMNGGRVVVIGGAGRHFDGDLYCDCATRAGNCWLTERNSPGSGGEHSFGGQGRCSSSHRRALFTHRC